jgi:hypothetical protein
MQCVVAPALMSHKMHRTPHACALPAPQPILLPTPLDAARKQADVYFPQFNTSDEVPV